MKNKRNRPESRWIHKKNMPNGDRLEKQTDSGKATLFLPIMIKGRVEKRGDDEICIFEKRKKYPSYALIFKRTRPSLTNSPDALNGKKIRITIEVID